MAQLASSLYTSQSGGKTAKPSHGLANNAKVLQASVAIPATGTGTALNDTIALCRLPKGAIPRSISLKTSQLDSNGSPLLTIDLGTPASAQLFVAAWAGASGAAGAAVSPNTVDAANAQLGVQLTVDTDIIATIHAAAATKAAGTMVCTVFYDVEGLAS